MEVLDVNTQGTASGVNRVVEESSSNVAGPSAPTQSASNVAGPSTAFLQSALNATGISVPFLQDAANVVDPDTPGQDWMHLSELITNTLHDIAAQRIAPVGVSLGIFPSNADLRLIDRNLRNFQLYYNAVSIVLSCF